MGMLEEVELSNGISLKTIIDEYVAKYGDPSSGGGGIPLHYHDIDEILELRELLVGTMHRLDVLEAGGSGTVPLPVLARIPIEVDLYSVREGVSRPMNPEAVDVIYAYQYGPLLNIYMQVANAGKCNSDPEYWILPRLTPPGGEMRESVNRLWLECEDRDFQMGIDMFLKKCPGTSRLGYMGKLPVDKQGDGGRPWGKNYPNDGTANTSWATRTATKWHFTGVW